MDYQLLKELIENLETFEAQFNSGNLEDFRIWLNEQAYRKDSPKELFEKFNKEVYNLENEICKQVILLSRFSRQMIRRGLEDFPALANEEFTYIYRLMDYGTLSKMELIEKNGHEKQTGMEIIRRLVKNGYLHETEDPNDKRKIRISVSELGRQIFDNSVLPTTEIARVLSGKLETAEKMTLLEILKKLNDFHFVVYHKYRQADITEINKLI